MLVLYLLYCLVKTKKSNLFIILFKIFPIFLVWWKIYFFPVVLVYKRSNFWHSGWFSIFSWFNAAVTANWKHLSSLLFWFVVCFLFFIQQGVSIYKSRFRLLWYLQYISLIISKKKKKIKKNRYSSLMFCKRLWYLVRNLLKPH